MFAKVAALFALSLGLAAMVPAAPLEARQGFSGDGTFYAPGLGSCGIQNTDADMIVAVSYLLFDTYPGATPNPNLNPICGRQLAATYGGKTITVAVTDRCAGCAGMYDLDFSPAAYNQLADPAAGRINPVTWNWL